jgi:hypothetical protein
MKNTKPIKFNFIPEQPNIEVTDRLKFYFGTQILLRSKNEEIFFV